MSSEIAIDVRGLGKAYPMYARPHHRLLELLLGHREGRWRREHRALHGVSFRVARGETVGIIGRNGSGKSTLLQLICGTLEPSAGEVLVWGRIAALLELGAGFNPEFTGRENVHLYGTVLGLTRIEVESRFARIEAFADIGEFIEQPVRTYSSGMFVRLAFAVAIHVDPDVLIVDEALSVGDEAFQRKCFARIEQLRDAGTTVLFVSHSSQTVVQLCDRALWLEDGTVRLDGSPRDVVAAYHREALSGPATMAASPKGNDDAGRPGDGHVLPFSSALVAYERSGGELSEATLGGVDHRGGEVLHRGQRYRFGYTLRVERGAEGARAGMMIRNRAGVEIAGASTVLRRLMGRDPGPGDAVRIEFEFDCLLYPGTYFLSCGVMASAEGGETYLHRLVDAFEIRVLPEPDAARLAEPQGAVDLRFDARATLRTGREAE